MHVTLKLTARYNVQLLVSNFNLLVDSIFYLLFSPPLLRQSPDFSLSIDMSQSPPDCHVWGWQNWWTHSSMFTTSAYCKWSKPSHNAYRSKHNSTPMFLLIGRWCTTLVRIKFHVWWFLATFPQTVETVGTHCFNQQSVIGNCFNIFHLIPHSCTNTCTNWTFEVKASGIKEL